MKSFRVIDTKFRILKGGKIGLSLSISLVTSSLIFSQISAHAETFFDNEWTTGTTYTTPDVTVTERSNTGINTGIYSQTSTTENIIFRPDRVAESYTGVTDNEISGTNSVTVATDGTTGTAANSIADGTYIDGGGFSATNYDYAHYTTLNPDTDFTVTLTSGSTVNNIVKETSTYYYVNSTDGYMSSSDAYVANIVFSGSNTVYGTTNIDDGNIKLDGSVTFTGTVDAGSIAVDTTSTITFNSDVDLTAGTTDAMNFSVNGNVLINEDFTGNITSGGDNLGTVTIVGNGTGKEQIITGNIGTSISSDIGILNIGSDTVASNYSRTVIYGDVYSNSTVLNNNGTTNSSTLVLADGSDITSTITTADANMGILTLNGSSTVSGQVGASGALLKEINAGANGSSSTFSSDVYATNLDVEGTGTVNLNGDYTGTAIRYNADGTVVLATGSDVNSAVTTATTNTGTLTLNGSSTVSGQVGASGALLKEINAGANGSSSTFSSDVYATNLDVEGTGTVNLNGDYTGTAIRYNADGTVVLATGSDVNSAVTTATTNTGTLTLNGSSTVSGQVGASGALLKEINAGANGSSSTFSSDVYATNLDVEGTGTVNLNGDYTGTAIRYNADGTVVLATGSDVNSAVTTATTNTGTLTLNGSSTVSGQVGASGALLKEINAGANGSSSTFSSDVYATNLDVEGTGTVNLNGDYTGTAIRYNADGTVVLATGSDVNSAVTTATTNTGTLTLNGSSTVSGQVGASGALLKEINAGANGSSSTFSSDVYATNLDVEGTGTVNLNGDYTGTAIRYNADGTVVLATGSDVNSAVTTATTNTGTLTLNGSSTVSGQVGASGALLKEINAGANGSSSTFSSDVYATNLDVEGTGTVNLNGDYTGTAIRYNADGTVVLATGSDVNSAVTTATTNTGTLTLNGSSTVSGQVGASGALLKEINAGANGSSSTFSSDVYATNLDVEGTGTVNLNGDYTGTAIRYNADGTVVLATGSDVNSAVTTATTNTGTLTLNGSSTVSGQVGASGALLKEINAGANGSNSTFSSDVYATTTNIGAGEIKFVSNVSTDIVALSTTQGIVTFVGDVSGKSQSFIGDIGSSTSLINTLNIGQSGTSTNYSSTTITGNVYATNIVLNNEGTNSSTLTLSDGSNITSTITTAENGLGILTFLGDSTINGTIGTTTEKLEQINVANTGKTVTFNSSINTDNLNILGDGEVILADNSNLNAPVTTSFNNQGTLTFEGTSNVSGQIGTSGALLKEITLQGASGEVVTFGNDVYVSNIVFESDGTANLNGNLTGNINFSGFDAIVNVADGMGILDSGGGLLGSVQTLANNTGILNYKGDGVIDGIIGSSGLGINELNVNTNDEQDKDGSGTVTSNGLLARREIFADIINLYNNATLTLADNANVTNTDITDSLIIATMTANTGNVVFEGSSTVTGDVGTSTNNLESITAGVTGETVTFDGMVYASTLKYSDNGTVVLNGDNASNAEGMKGTVDFGSSTGTLEIGDNVNLTTGTSGIQFANANNAILRFNGSSTVYGVLGGNTAGNSTFESIYAGVTGETVTFKNDVYVKESTFHVSGDGIVNLEGNLYGDLVFDNDGTVNVANTKSIIVSTTPLAITTANNGQGTINFEGTTTLYTDIGEDLFRLKEVNFGTVGTASNSYTQNINKDIYANDITIGNSSNKTTANLTSDMTFYGNLNVSSNSVLDVNNHDITVENGIVLASNSTLKFEIDTSDLIAGQAVANDTSGSIDANSLDIQDDIKVHIDYNGTLAGKYEYNLISANSSTGTYTEGNEANGKVSDNSIIDSKVVFKDNNLVLVADRTNNGSFNPEDLYIEKSEIGKDYSNGASQALADYANGVDRAGALAQIINELEYLEGGTVLSEAKKQEMIETQRKLAPIANSSNMQTSITASNLAMTTIKGRLSDIRTGEMNNFTPTLYRTGLSSGDYYSFDTSFWLKGMAGKATQDQVDEYYGFNTSTYGFVGGMDKISGDGTIFGAALAYSTTKTNQENAASDSSDTTSIQGTIYSSSAFENAYVDTYLSYAKHKTDGTRTANSGKLTSSVDAEQISAKVETGYTIPVNDGVSLTPFASLEYSLLNQKGYTEKGTTYQNDALKVDGLKLNRGTVELGAKLTSNIELEDTLLIPQLSVSAYNSFGDNSADIKAQYVGGGKEFVTPVTELNKTMYNVGLGLETKISDSTSLIFDMDYDRSKDGKFQGYSGSVTFGISF